jgi:uncharacterized membrane protein required for colicin V production
MSFIPVLIVLCAVAFITYLWTVRGFFSAFLHMLCIIVAGAIAFGLWEPIAYWLLQTSPRGFIADAAWGLSLALPFAIIALLLRVASDKLILSNAQPGTAVNYAGGAVCGLVAAIISVGIMVISLQYLRMQHESWATYKAIDYTDAGTARGSLQKNTSPFRPWVDELTAAFYKKMSMGALSTPTPLAELQPDVALVSTGMRMNFSENNKLGQSRNTVAPSDFELIKRYTVGDTVAGEPVTRGGGITEDSQQPGVPQGFVDLKGNQITRGYLAGYVVKFKAGAKEQSGQIVIGNGQVNLVVASKDGTDHKTLFPIAAISQTDASSSSLGRWRFDNDNFFIASVGGATEAPFAFEFLVPAGYDPKYLYVKNVRTDVSAPAQEEFDRVSTRDRAISSGTIVKPATDARAAAASIDWSDVTTVSGASNLARESGFNAQNQIGKTLQRGNHGSLEIEEHGRSWWILNGDHEFSRAQANTRILEASLRIDALAVSEGTVVVKINVSAGQPGSLASRAAATANANDPPILVDSLGQHLQAVGFLYEDNTRYHLRYTPGKPIDAITEAPALSNSRPDQTMEFIFLCNKGTTISAFLIGDKAIVRYDPPISLDVNQR